VALTPLPENNTARLFVHYQTGGGTTAQEHVLTIRYNAALATPADIMLDLAAALTDNLAESQLFTGWSVTSAETQAQGAQIRLPTAVPAALSNVLGSGQSAATPQEQAREVRFIGRGLTSGRRASMSLYGLITGAIRENDFRFEPTAGDLLANQLLTMKGLGLTGAAYSTIAGDGTNWYDYVNWQFNSHWETEQRA
jgi:hypothetical protein